METSVTSTSSWLRNFLHASVTAAQTNEFGMSHCWKPQRLTETCTTFQKHRHAGRGNEHKPPRPLQGQSDMDQTGLRVPIRQLRLSIVATNFQVVFVRETLHKSHPSFSCVPLSRDFNIHIHKNEVVFPRSSAALKTAASETTLWLCRARQNLLRIRIRCQVENV